MWHFPTATKLLTVVLALIASRSFAHTTVSVRAQTTTESGDIKLDQIHACSCGPTLVLAYLAPDLCTVKEVFKQILKHKERTQTLHFCTELCMCIQLAPIIC